MEEEGLVICDSDVLIEFLDRGNKLVEDRLVNLGRHRLCISSITHSEIIFASYNKQHQKKLTKGLESFTLIEIDAVIDSIHRDLINRYSISHRLGIQDAIVAATSLKDNNFLFTLNKKDFSFIPRIRLIK
jgi:tRNA(fMet)-specific endonuclease VapC